MWGATSPLPEMLIDEIRTLPDAALDDVILDLGTLIRRLRRDGMYDPRGGLGRVYRFAQRELSDRIHGRPRAERMVIVLTHGDTLDKTQANARSGMVFREIADSDYAVLVNLDAEEAELVKDRHGCVRVTTLRF